MAHPTIDNVSSLSVADSLNFLGAHTENQWFARRSAHITQRELVETLNAFSNAEGGTVAVGLINCEPSPVMPAKESELRYAADDYTTGPSELTITTIGLQRGNIVLFTVPPATLPHYTASGDCFMRVNADNIRLSYSDRLELSLDRRTAPFECRPSKIQHDDLSDEDVDRLQNALGLSGVDATLKARGLVTDDEQLNVAACLLLARRPYFRLPGAYINISTYDTDIKIAGQNTDVLHEYDVHGTIPAIIREGHDLVEDLLATEPFNDSLVSKIPSVVIKEAISNAVIHRCYALTHIPVEIRIFPSRIEITNPGRFPGGMDPNRPSALNRVCRNPRIARVCYDLGLSDGHGNGIRTMSDRLEKAGLLKPFYHQSSDAVRLTLAGVSTTPSAQLANLSRGAKAVLEALRVSGEPLRTGDVVSILGIARPTALRHLKALRDNDIIGWTGEAKNDPKATWHLQ